MSEERKLCSDCRQIKDESDFPKNGKYRKNGTKTRKPVCKVCHCKRAKEYWQSNRDALNAIRSDPNNKKRFSYALRQSCSSAKRGGYFPCTATVGELKILFTGKCAICGVLETELNRKLCLDHNHITGEARGFLCGACNNAIGLFRDSKELLQEAIYYLNGA